MIKLHSFKNRKIFIFILLSVIYSSTAFSFDAYNDEHIEVFEVTSSVEIPNDNTLYARETAIRKCFTKAVNLALSKILLKKTCVENIDALRADIYDNPEKFIKSYKVLYETSFRQFYTISLSADIMYDKMIDELYNICGKNEASKIKITVEVKDTVIQSRQKDSLSSMVLDNERLESEESFDDRNLSLFDYRGLRYFIRFDRKLRRIDNIVESVITEIIPNKREMIITFEGSGTELAQALMAINFETFELDVEEISDNFLKIDLTPYK